MVKGWDTHPARDALGVHRGSEPGGDVKNCLEKVKRKKKKGKQNMRKHTFFPIGLVFIILAS